MRKWLHEHLWKTIPEHIFWIFLCGVLIVLTGVTPEEWIKLGINQLPRFIVPAISIETLALAARLFLGSLGIVVACGAIIFAARGQKNRPQSVKRRRMLPLIGMIVFGFGFIVCAAWYFWPALPSQTAKESTSPTELTIEKLWRDDFAIGSYRMLQGFGIDLFKEGGEKLGTFDIGVGMYGDFDAKSLFMSLYVPGSDHGYDVIGWFAEGYKDYLHDARTNIHLWTAPQGDLSQPLSDDLLFTNRIYIYYENILSDAQILVLANLYKSKGLEPVFRGLGYLEHERLMHRALAPPRVPMSASPDFKMPRFTPAPKNDDQHPASAPAPPAQTGSEPHVSQQPTRKYSKADAERMLSVLFDLYDTINSNVDAIGRVDSFWLTPGQQMQGKQTRDKIEIATRTREHVRNIANDIYKTIMPKYQYYATELRPLIQGDGVLGQANGALNDFIGAADVLPADANEQLIKLALEPKQAKLDSVMSDFVNWAGDAKTRIAAKRSEIESQGQ